MKIGPFEHDSRVVVAPMAGVTDQPFRNLCRDLGAYWTVSEMVTSDKRLWHTRKSRNRLRFHDEQGPRWVQIAGGDPDMLSEAAKLNEDLGAQIIDINMGCPAKKVCNKAAGSALLKDVKLVAEILSEVVAAVSVPVTLKIRLGWSLDSINAVEIARIAEDSGIQLLTVHGRSRACKFQGVVHYGEIAQVVDAVNIPVIANGDIDSPIKAASVLKQTGAAAVMIGRAAQGQPWLVAQVDEYLKTKKLQKNPSLGEINRLLAAHITNLSTFYGPEMGPRIARKHVGWFFQGLLKTETELGMLKTFNRLGLLEEQIYAIDMMFEVLINRMRGERNIAA